MRSDRDADERPGLVLVHGGHHMARCWAPTVAELQHQVPDLPVLAVDLPGRGDAPADPGSVTVGSCVDRVFERIDTAGLDQVVVVGHSLGGLTMPGVAARLGAARVARLVFIATLVPPQGTTAVQLIPWPPLRWSMARLWPPGRSRRPPPRPLARLAFCNGMTRQQRELVYDQLCPEATNLFHEPAERTGMPASVPRTWILPRRDRACPPRYQRSYIDNLGGVDEVVEIDTCHDVMISEPARLAAILAERCRPDRAIPVDARG